MSTDVLSRLRHADPCPTTVSYDDGVAQSNIDSITHAGSIVGATVAASRSRPRSLLAVAAAAVVLAAVGSVVGVEFARDGGSTRPVASGTNGVRSSPPAVAPVPPGTGMVPGPGVAPSWTEYSANGVSFEHPRAWQSYRYEVVSATRVLVTYLSTSPVPEPCVAPGDATGTPVACPPRVPDLRAGGVFVDWTSDGTPGQTIGRYSGITATIAGHDARIARNTVPDACRTSGAVTGVRAAVSTTGSNVLVMTACIGPGDVDADLAAVDRMLASLRTAS